MNQRRSNCAISENFMATTTARPASRIMAHSWGPIVQFVWLDSLHSFIFIQLNTEWGSLCFLASSGDTLCFGSLEFQPHWLVSCSCYCCCCCCCSPGTVGQNKFKCRQQGGSLMCFLLTLLCLKKKKLIYNFAFASVRAAKQVDLQPDIHMYICLHVYCYQS